MANSYKCKVCSYSSLKWQGKCPECEAWNSFEEVAVKPKNAAGKPPHPNLIAEQAVLNPLSLEELAQQLKSSTDERIYEFSAPPLNAFWGGGLVAGSLTLLAGEPGLGKSTLALQLLRTLWKGAEKSKLKDKPGLLYITAEESSFELARRSLRLDIPREIMILQSNSLEQIEGVLNTSRPQVVIIDSIQTIFSQQVQSAPGSVAQVSNIAAQLLAISKSRNISLIVIGHVTKEGQIAGPKTLEHLVDSVLTLEPAENPQYRSLSFSKHRFGQTSSLMLMKMESNGLQIVADPSLALLENVETGVGVAYGLALDKDLPLVVEIQALVVQSGVSGNYFGRREAIGLKGSKLNTILAIIEKYLDLSLQSCDVYLQITGLPKSLVDDSLDLAILMSILSSVANAKISELIISKTVKQTEARPTKPVYAGRLTLSGNLRQATNDETRKNTAKKLGFEYNWGINKSENLKSSLGPLLNKLS
jgi:DNA repair protein RadA/Sms